jgi:nucleoid-associated protein YgaU
MGLFESIKNTFSKSEPTADVTAAPSQLLREAGLDPSGLKFTFGNAEITVKGSISNASDRQKILDVLSGIPGITSVQDQMSVSASAAAVEPATAAEQAEPTRPEEPAASGEGEARTYTVVSGDTLWKIAERMYGNGSQYMRIFDANTDLLENPDRIFPGQKLIIPE